MGCGAGLPGGDDAADGVAWGQDDAAMVDGLWLGGVAAGIVLCFLCGRRGWCSGVGDE